MSEVRMMWGGNSFIGQLEHEKAPLTCARFLELLPWRARFIHVRWSGEAAWVPLGDRDFEIGSENATSCPRPGDMLFYPGGISETELLLAYGPVRFSSKAGQLAGNHFLTFSKGHDVLAELGRRLLEDGAAVVEFVAA